MVVEVGKTVVEVVVLVVVVTGADVDAVLVDEYWGTITNNANRCQVAPSKNRQLSADASCTHVFQLRNVMSS